MKTEVKTYIEKFSLNRSNDLFSSSENETERTYIQLRNRKVPKYINEFWTAKQRQAANIHEISYRACFKPQLPEFFINLVTDVGDTIYDPFCGRGTTPIQAGLMGRKVIANDVNPLSLILTKPRLLIPDYAEIENRLNEVEYNYSCSAEFDLSMFYHPKTEAEIVSLKRYFKERKEEQTEDEIDSWIRMVATNRLTGHSPGFFSVYTLPPNQATTKERQIKINEKRGQVPEYRNTKEIILRKSTSLLKGLSKRRTELLRTAGRTANFLTEDARFTHEIPANSVTLTVTSPPFLDIVQYAQDNWLRCWFNGIDIEEIGKKTTVTKNVDEWSMIMGKVFEELFRITQKTGWVAFEVGELRKGKLKLEDYVIPAGEEAGFNTTCVVINQQDFTKTSNIWGIDNNESGTNTNRIVLFQKV
jgi:hypothetical protein